MVRITKQANRSFVRDSSSIYDSPLCIELDEMKTQVVFQGPDGFPSFDLFAAASADHTDDHFECPACMAANIALQAEKTNISVLPFNQAAKFWKLRRAQSPKLKPRTHEATDGYLDDYALDTE